MDILDRPQLTPEQIKNFRRANGLSQQDLATQLGVGIATVGRWEQGTPPTGMATAILRTIITGPTLGPRAAVVHRAGYAIYQLLKGVFEPHTEERGV